MLFDEKNTESSITWKTDKKHLLVFCGSLGARSIFEEVLKNIDTIMQDYEVIMALGKLNSDMRQRFESCKTDDNSLQILDWLDKKNQKSVFEGTDIAITR